MIQAKKARILFEEKNLTLGHKLEYFFLSFFLSFCFMIFLSSFLYIESLSSQLFFH